MVDLTEVAGHSHDTASAMHEARAVLGRAAWLLGEDEVDKTLSRLLKDVESTTAPVGQLRRLEDDATLKRRQAWQTGDRGMAEQSEAADSALRSAYNRPHHEIAGIAEGLRTSVADVGRLHGDLERSRKQLNDALGHANALHAMPEYGGTDATRDLVANVDGLKQIVDKVERDVGDGLEGLKTAQTIASRFGQEPPNVRGGQLTEDLVSTSGKIQQHLTKARTAFQDAGTFRMNDVESARQHAVDFAETAKSAQKNAEDLKKSVQAATNPTPASGQQTPAQAEMRRRLDGHAQGTGVEL
jgi:hypothetical protein